MLNNISIKTKLISLSVIVSLSFLLILIIELISINKIDNISIISNNIKNMEIQLLELRKNEKDFLVRKDLKYLDNFQKNIQNIEKMKNTLDNEFTKSDIDQTELNNYKKLLMNTQIFLQIL
jgi:methyl-accepting chemotaxis protein